MNNKKRILLLSLSCALAFVIALCGFNAYANSDVKAVSTDGVSSSNLVQQLQYQIVKNDNSVTVSDLSENKTFVALGDLYPAVYTGTTFEKEEITAGDFVIPVWKDLNGAVDDIVCAKNIAEEPIYVRTVFAFEAGNATASFHDTILLNRNTIDWEWSDLKLENSKLVENPDGVYTVTIDNVTYWVISATYKANDSQLAKDVITAPSLYQIALTNDISKEHFRSFGGQYDVKIASQAATVDFKAESEYDNQGISATADMVLNEVHGSIGDITATKHPWN